MMGTDLKVRSHHAPIQTRDSSGVTVPELSRVLIKGLLFLKGLAILHLSLQP